MKNGAETPLVVAIPTGSAVGMYRDNDPGHAVAVTNDDYISYRCVNGGTSNVIVSSINSILSFNGAQ
jgi:hypothetical protein